MNILFMSLLDFDSLSERNIYTDLLRQFVINGHDLAVISPFEKKAVKTEKVIKEHNCTIIKIKIGNIQKVNIVEKGISTMMLENQIIHGIKKYLNTKKFDLVLYTTPPITFQNAISFVKRRDKAVTYLLLKDIFPQNALDLGMLTTKGWKGWIYNYFRNKECNLYRISDYIGCLSQANVDYILKHNPFVRKDHIEVCPNSIEVMTYHDEVDRIVMREKYGIPKDKKIIVYGGNLGKPQGIKDLLLCIRECETKNIFFLIIGSGTEYKYLEQYVKERKPYNLKIMPGLPKEEYEMLVRCCDVGLVSLDKRFTIPNFPCRMLSYMQASLPVLAMTDVNTDIRKAIEEGEFGYWCESGDVNGFSDLCRKMQDNKSLTQMGKNARKYLENFYSVERGYEIIMRHMQKKIG